MTDVNVTGVHGVNGQDGQTPGASGKAGTAGGAITGDAASIDVSNSAEVYGGQGGNGGGGLVESASGNATAIATAYGLKVTSTAVAKSGFETHATPGIASAKAYANGVSGSFSAQAEGQPLYSVLVEDLSTNASGIIHGTAATTAIGIAEAGTSFATAVKTDNSSDEAIARFVATPHAADVNKVRTANSNIAKAFGSSSTTFAIGELGGAYDENGLGTETIKSSVSMEIDPDQVKTAADLTLGLYNGTEIGQGFRSLTFEVAINSVDILSKTFTSVAAAVSYFQNNVLDIEALPKGGFVLGLSLTEAITKPGSGFYGDIIAGNAPPSSAAASAAQAPARTSSLSGFIPSP